MATTPGEGHVNPMVPVARELVQRGHEVRWYTGKVFQDKVTGTGARYEPMRAAYDFGGRTREEAFPEHVGLTGTKGMIAGFRDIFVEPAPDQMADLLDLLAEFPADVLVTDETFFGAGFVSERTGIPVAWVATSIYVFSSRDTAPLGLGLPPNGSFLGRARNAVLKFLTDHVVMRDLRSAADTVRGRVGLPRIPKGAFENIMRAPDLYLLGTVPSFEYPRSDLAPQVHFVGPFVAPAPADFTPPPWWPELHAGRPVVHVTQGTVANDAERLLLPAIRALATEDVTVVATTGVDPARLRLGRLPDNVRLERFVPHHALLPHVDAMVTNGGYGGVNTALAHGVPLVVAAATEEKHEVAARVSWAGAGIHLKKRTLSEDDIRAAVRRVLDEPRFRRAARRLQDEYTTRDAAVTAVDLIEELVKTRR
nr:RebG-like glycosyltransferase [uncultured bacterium]